MCKQIRQSSEALSGKELHQIVYLLHLFTKTSSQKCWRNIIWADFFGCIPHKRYQNTSGFAAVLVWEIWQAVLICLIFKTLSTLHINVIHFVDENGFFHWNMWLLPRILFLIFEKISFVFIVNNKHVINIFL